ncbi:unnamed protein product [Lasius platythorax]|uniref:Uncharacterized protein n=1 Tax=Lasius platythorax TaxID=488582 RepID=A0AAV2NA07_9HYME
MQLGSVFHPVNRTALCREIHHSGKLLISLSKLTTCTKYPASAVTERLASGRGREAVRLTHLGTKRARRRKTAAILSWTNTPGDLSRDDEDKCSSLPEKDLRGKIE